MIADMESNKNKKANGLKVSAVISLFFPNRAPRARRWSFNSESTLSRGRRGQIVCDGRFFSVLFYFLFLLEGGSGGRGEVKLLYQ